MDPPEQFSSRESSSSSFAAAAAAPRPAGDISLSLPPLTPCYASASDSLCAQVDVAAAAEPRNKPHLGAAAKRAASPTEYDLFAAMLRRRRRRAPGVVAAEAPVTSSAKSSASAGRDEEAAPLGDRNPNKSATADSSNISEKPDHHAGGEPTNSTSSARGAAREAGGRIGSLKSYEWIGVQGKGGFGTVVKARDARTGEVVAIKSWNDEGGGRALLREAALLASCRGNPGVVGLREVLRGPGRKDAHIVMDFVGRSLRGLLRARRRLPEPETRGAMRQLLAGVEMMGRQGVVHGDLKPENLLVDQSQTDDGGVDLKICDFGLSVSVAAPPCHVDGTLHYLAPEQLLGDNCGPPVDAWALGCVMGELLTGKPLVDGYCHADQLTKTIEMLAVPDDVSLMALGVDASTSSKLRDSVPEEVLSRAGFEVLRGLLQYEPDKRLTPAVALNMRWFANPSEVTTDS